MFTSADYIAFTSAESEIFKAVINGAKDTLGANLSMAYIDKSNSKTLNRHLASLKQGRFKGVIVIGKPALDIVKDKLPPQIPTVICAYSEFSNKEMTLADNIPHEIFTVMTPLTEYDSFISDVFPEARKLAIIHKTNFDVPEIKTIETKVYQIYSWSDLKSTVAAAIKWGDIVWIPADPAFTSTALAHIIKSNLRNKTPLLTSSPRIIKGGAISGLVSPPDEVGNLAAQWIRAKTNNDHTWLSKNKKIQPLLVNNPKVTRFLKVELPSYFKGRKRVTISDYKE